MYGKVLTWGVAHGNDSIRNMSYAYSHQGKQYRAVFINTDSGAGHSRLECWLYNLLAL